MVSLSATRSLFLLDGARTGFISLHQNFLSAATGIVLAVALIRGFARASAQTVGNFWVDITRCTLYVLLPICVPYTLFLVWQGMPQTLGAYVDAITLEGATQSIAVGPVASQVAIKMLGTNGGGFFNANAAHPFENPTALSNYLQIISIFALGAALTNVFGRMVGNQRAEFPVDCFDLCRLYQFAMRNAHRMQRALELLLPEGQEAVQFGKFGEQIVVLPDIGLEQPAMIGAPV
jgi:K+-transporting ATPase A subunit